MDGGVWPLLIELLSQYEKLYDQYNGIDAFSDAELYKPEGGISCLVGFNNTED